MTLDLGAQWVGPGQSEMRRLITQHGLQVVPTAVPGRTIWALNRQVTLARAALPPMPPQALADLLAGGARLALMSWQVLTHAPWQARRATQWDQITAADWIRRYIRTPEGRACARMLIRADAAIEPDETSLLGLLFDLRSVGGARNLARAEMFRLPGGTHELARRLSEQVRGRIRLADPVRAISQDSAGVTVESDGCALRCRRVAVCLPPPLAHEIRYTPALPQQRARLLASRPMGAAVKFHAIYARPFWRDRGLSGQALSSSGTVCLTYDNSPDDGTGRGALVGLVVADQARRLSALDPSRQEQEILGSLGGLLGLDAQSPDSLVIQDWCREVWTRGCYAAHFPPGVWTSYGGAFSQPCRRIHWAGTETSTAWHGYMEGALRSAARVAREMLQADAVKAGRP